MRQQMADSRITGSQILCGKHAVVFGAGGSLGGEVAKEFSAEGAEVFLAGRTKSNVDDVAQQITAAGGRAHAAVVDAYDDASVDKYIDDLVKQTGRIDSVFNAVGPPPRDYGSGKHVVDLTVEEFMVPVTTVLKSQFITARSAARHMVRQRSGVIIFLTGSPVRGHVEGGAAIGTAFGAIETLMENLALEIGTAGVRAVCLRTTANTDSRTIQQVMDAQAGMMNATKDQMIGVFASLNFLKVPASISDTAKLAALLASDRVRMVTGTVVNSTAGAALD